MGPDGETAQCGRAADWDILGYGNIKDKSLKEIFSDKQRKLVDSRFEVLQTTDCKGCEYWRICHGGCPLDAYNKYKDFYIRQTNVFQKTIFKEIFRAYYGIETPTIWIIYGYKAYRIFEF